MPSGDVTVEIERLAKEGEGLAHLDGRAVFVDGALPGERVRTRLERGKVLRGQLVEVLKPSPDRRAPVCPLFGECGGCDWLHAAEPLQRAQKLEIVQSTLEHLGGIARSTYQTAPTVAGPRGLGTRRRAVLHPVAGGLGLHGRKSHTAVRIDHCPALSEALAALPGQLAAHLGPALARVREAQLLAEGPEVAFALLLKGSVDKRVRAAGERAVQKLGARGAVLVPERGPSVLLGNPVLRGLSPLVPEAPLYLRPDAFAQSHAELNQALVASALTELAPQAGERVLELYAGSGNFTIPVAALAGTVVAVESSPVSVALGQRATLEAGLGHVRWIQGDAMKVARGLAREAGQAFDKLLVDPPRVGAKGLGQLAAGLGVRAVVYVACDPAALARDARELGAHGYLPVRLQLVDMFPNTHHVEAVLSLARR